MEKRRFNNGFGLAAEEETREERQAIRLSGRKKTFSAATHFFFLGITISSTPIRGSRAYDGRHFGMHACMHASLGIFWRLGMGWTRRPDLRDQTYIQMVSVFGFGMWLRERL